MMYRIIATIVIVTFISYLCSINIAKADQLFSAEFFEDGELISPDPDGSWISKSGKVTRDGLEQYEIHTKKGLFSVVPRCWCHVLYGGSTINCLVDASFPDQEKSLATDDRDKTSETPQTNNRALRAKTKRLKSFRMEPIKRSLAPNTNIKSPALLIVRVAKPVLEKDTDGNLTGNVLKFGEPQFDEWFAVFCHSPGFKQPE